MKPSALDFLRPASLPDAFAALQSEQAAPLSGGQSLLILLRLRLTAVTSLVDVSRLPDLTATQESAEAVVYGAATTHASFEDRLLPDASAGLMAHVATGIAYRAVRNFGTIGGSLALADPSADWPLCLLALRAVVLLAGPAGRREVPMDAFLISAFTTDLAPGEVITGIRVSVLAPASRWGYAKLARKHGAFADSLAAVVWPQGGPPMVALGATMRRPCLLSRSMSALAAAEDVAADTIAADVAEADPDADDYRLRCHVATVQRALMHMRRH